MHYETLKLVAIPFLLNIRKKMTETYGISVLDEKQRKNLILYSVQGPDYSCFTIKEKTRTPLHTSAPGKALVAFLPEKRREAIVRNLSFERLTPNTITDRDTYEALLTRIRETGYATDLAEELPYCHCGGVPILDAQGHSVAALWLSGVNTRLPDSTLLKNIRILQRTAKKIEAKLRLQFSAIQTINVPVSPCVRNALQLLQEKISEPVNYPSLARVCHVSYSTLRTSFHKETGTTLGRYHMDLRIQKVQQLLMTTTLTITEIADTMGFYDQKHLSALFKRETGISPLHYRKQTRPAEGEEEPEP